MPKPDLEALRTIIAPALQYAGVSLFDLQYGGGTLRVVIDKAGGVSLEDCERVATAAGAALDAYDPIDGRYHLEVSSPGAERPLRDVSEFRDALGKHVLVRYRTEDTEVSVQGLLSAVSEAHITVTTAHKTRRTEHEIALDDVVSARIAIAI